MGSRINWNEVVKKEAKGKNDEDLGEVQEVKDNYVLVQRGKIKKEIFYIPKDQAESYDDSILKFKFSEQDLLIIKMKYLTISLRFSELKMREKQRKV